MKKFYKDFSELMTQLDSMARKKVKHYFTDWTEYDIPNLKKYMASTDRIEKRLTLILRDCGTWLIFTDDINKPGTGANTIYNYYKPYGIENRKENTNKFYNIDLLALSIIELKFDENGHIIQPKKANKKRRAAA